MPLIQSPKKSALKENIKTEIDAHPSKGKRPQDIAIAYSVQRKNKGKKHKMAEGGKVAEEYGKGPEEDMEPAVPGRKKDDERPSMDAILSDQFTSGSNPDVMEDAEDAPPKKDYSGERYAAGGMIDEAPPHTGETMQDMLRRHADEIKGLSSDNDQIRPAEKDYMGKDWAGGPDLEPKDDEEDAPAESDYMSRRDAAAYAMGGSVADKIRNKRKMADGGEVDLGANSEESPNMEDQYSYKANGKEQYDLSQLSKQPKDSNEKGDSREMSAENIDDESLVDAIRKKLRAKRGE